MMKRLKLRRTFQEGWHGFRRNGWLTTATVSVLTISLFIVSLTVLSTVTTNAILKEMREKIDITVSFQPEVSEERILSIKRDLEQFREITGIEYVSREAALDRFLQGSGNEEVISKALEEIGGNPLLASLSIKAESLDDYEMISKAVDHYYQDDIARTNYEKNKRVIERLHIIQRITSRVGVTLGIIFVFTALFTAFNTISLNIHARRNEFEIMRLVGASNLYVRFPSMVEGILYGIVAAVVTTLLLLATPFVAFDIVPSLSSGAISDLVGKLSFFHYLVQHLWIIFLGLLVLGSFLGAIGGFMAVRKYLKI